MTFTQINLLRLIRADLSLVKDQLNINGPNMVNFALGFLDEAFHYLKAFEGQNEA